MLARRAWLLVNVYKAAYLILIVASLTITYVRWGFGPQTLSDEPLAIAIAFFVANLVSWLAFLSGTLWGYFSERVLSIGRMVAIVLCAMLIVADLVVYLSPVGASVWLLLVELTLGQDKWTKMYQLFGWWLGCALLLGLESIYFYCLGYSDPDNYRNVTTTVSNTKPAK